MSAKIIDGKAAAATLREEVAKEVARFRVATGRVPGLATVLVGEDPASAVASPGRGLAPEARAGTPPAAITTQASPSGHLFMSLPPIRVVQVRRMTVPV